jgi:hypothetical protein
LVQPFRAPPLRNSTPKKTTPQENRHIEYSVPLKKSIYKSWRVEIGWGRIVATKPVPSWPAWKVPYRAVHFPLPMLPSPPGGAERLICLSFAWCDHIQIISAISRLLHADKIWLEEKKPLAWLFQLDPFQSGVSTEKERPFRLQTPLSATLPLLYVRLTLSHYLYLSLASLYIKLSVRNTAYTWESLPSPSNAKAPQDQPYPTQPCLPIHPSSWV